VEDIDFDEMDDMQEAIYNYYNQTGGGTMSVFAGARRPGMMGGGFFSTLARFALPILRSIGGRVMRVAARTARDVMGQKRNIGDALLQHSSRELSDALQNPSSPPSSSSNINKQHGSGIKKRKRALDIFTASLKRRRQK
jgi:hypothetical protein